VFYFIAPYLDYDESKERGKWYCRQLYAIMCTRIHLHLDWEAQSIRDAVLNSKEELLNFCEGIVLGTHQFDKVCPKQKLMTKSPQKLPAEGDRFHILEKMPADCDSEPENIDDLDA
jgi:hypothetical protein